MFRLKQIIFIALVSFSFVSTTPVFAENAIKVVATTKTFADLVKQVGGDRVKVDYVAPAGQNVHFIQPRPSSVVKLSKADLFVHAGLDLEAWRGPFVEAAGKNKFLPNGEAQLDVSKGIRLLQVPEGDVTRAEGDIHLFGNPHYWLDPRNGKVMARNIYEKLSEMYPDFKNEFEDNLNRFIYELDEKIAAWQNQLEPIKGNKVLSYHNSWPYFAEFCGIEIAGEIEPRPGIPPTAKHLARITKIIRDEQVKAIIYESYFERSTPNKLAKETGAKVLKLSSGVGEVKQARDYISMFDYNVESLIAAIGRKSNV